ncbi:MAG: hypothetical protein WBB69_10460 [Anaerolineales bacterium]
MRDKNDDNRNGFQSWLPDWSGISVEVHIPEQDGRYTIHLEIDLSPQAIKNFKEFDPETKGITPLTYFKVRDETGKPKTTFAPPLKLHVRYSARAWFKSASSRLGKGARRPRVYSLQKDEEDNWVGDWVEFKIEKHNIKPPADEYSYGHLYIDVPELPDPKIGGC